MVRPLGEVSAGGVCGEKGGVNCLFIARWHLKGTTCTANGVSGMLAPWSSFLMLYIVGTVCRLGNLAPMGDTAGNDYKPELILNSFIAF